jgi:uncharacterized protein YjdB
VPASPRALLLSLLAVAAANARPAAAQTVAEVQVTPETMTLPVGQKQTVFAAAFDRQGNLISNARFTFRSSDTTIVRVGADGVVVGLAPGLARVEARAQTRRSSLAVLVTGPDGAAGAAPLSGPGIEGVTLTLEPASLRLLPGETAQLTPLAVTDAGNAGSPGAVTWKSLRPELAVVDSSGLVTAVADGRTIIQAAAANGLMATAPIEVQSNEVVLSKSRIALPPDGLDTLQVLVPSQNNRVLTSGATWSSTDSSVVRVGPTGIVQGVQPGKAEVLARGYGQQLRATVVVHPVPSTVVLTPRPGTTPILVPLGQSRRVTASAQAADSSPIPEVRIRWELADSTLAEYDPASGELKGRALGTSSLTARVAGFQPASWAFTVVPNRLRLDRPRVGLRPGGKATVAGSLLDEEDRVAGPAIELTWTSDRPEVAAVDPSGAITAGRIGRAAISAVTPWGASARTDIFVTGDLLFASNRGGGLGVWQSRLAAPDTLYPILTDGFVNTQPVFSPDRTRIAFSSNREGSYDLYVMDADGGNLRQLTTDPGSEGEPAWTPDGTRLVYTVRRQGAPPQLYVLRPDGRPAQSLTTEPGGNHSPAISVDGRSLAFVSTRDGNQEIYVMAVEGGAHRRITRTVQRDSQPRFLPNGDLIYVVERGRGSRLVRWAGAEGEPETVLETGEPIGGLAVSRDGRRVAYVVGRLTDVSRSKAQFRLFVRRLVPDAAAAQVTLRPGEHVLSPAF